MSNSTPPAVRARERERKAREKHAKQVIAERKTRWWSGARLVWTVIAFLVFTAIPALLTYFPRLTVAQAGTIRPHDAMGTVFNVTNGPLPIYDVEQTCIADITAADGRPIVSGLGIGMQPLGDIGAGDTKSLNCQHAASRFNAQTSLTIAIKYRPLLWFWKITKAFPLQAEKADDGTWVWKSL
jgi:hypothetical protein